MPLARGIPEGMPLMRGLARLASDDRALALALWDERARAPSYFANHRAEWGQCGRAQVDSVMAGAGGMQEGSEGSRAFAFCHES